MDALGYPIDLRITAGQVHDVTQASTLLSGKKCHYVLADKGFDAGHVIELIRAQGS